jgi:hypothetical protein
MSTSYVCALSGDKTSDPVVTKAGFIFDRAAIEAHITRSKKCPKTGAPLSKDDLIPILSSDGKPGGGAGKKQHTKRMIADADTAIIDNSLMPEPVVLIASSVCGAWASTLVFPVVIFRILEICLLVFLPIFTGIWGLIAALQSTWVVAQLGLDVAPSTVAVVGSLIAVASYGVYSEGTSGCSTRKAIILPFVALVINSVLNSPVFFEQPFGGVVAVYGFELCTQQQFWVGLPLVMAAAASQGPAVKAYLEANQKASVAMALQVRV